MKLLADESCAGPVVRALRSAGHDVVSIAETAKGASDENVIEAALRAGAPHPAAANGDGRQATQFRRRSVALFPVLWLESSLLSLFFAGEAGRRGSRIGSDARTVTD